MKAVNVTTQAQWDVVSKELGYNWRDFSSWEDDKELTCINLDQQLYDDIDWYKRENATILTFNEWLLEHCKEKYKGNPKVKSTIYPDKIETIISHTIRHWGTNSIGADVTPIDKMVLFNSTTMQFAEIITEAPKKSLEGGWCVKCDGSEEFKKVMRKMFPNETKKGYEFDLTNQYYGVTTKNNFNLLSTSSQFNNNILTLDELKELIEYKETQPEQPHICKYCKAETTQDDEECYANPNQPEQREIVGYASPCDMPYHSVKKGDMFRKSEMGEYYYGGIGGVFCVKLVESLFTPIYKKTEADEQAENWDEIATDWAIHGTSQNFKSYAKQQTKFKLVRNENN